MKLLLGRLVLGWLLLLLVATEEVTVDDEEKLIDLPEAEKSVNVEEPVAKGKKVVALPNQPVQIQQPAPIVIQQPSQPPPRPVIIQPARPPTSIIVKPIPSPQHQPVYYYQPTYYPYPYVPQPYYPPPPPPPPPVYYVKPGKPFKTQVTHVKTIESETNRDIKPVDVLTESTGHLWNLIDQKNNEFWNFFQNKHNNENNAQGVQGIVVVNQDFPGPQPIYSYGGGSPDGGSSWFNKGKNILVDSPDCNKEK